jgi:hypothetical protein
VLWWRGLGVFGAIALAFGWTVATSRQIAIYVPAIVVFVIANVIRYQPWELDNTKLLYAAWIPLALPFVSQYLIAIANRKSTIGKVTGITLVAFFIAASGLSALMSTVQSLFWPTSMFSLKDYRFGLWFAENSPPDAVVLFPSSPGNTVACIAGRQLFFGFAGWVSSHGLDLSRGREMAEMYRHPDDLDRFRRNHVSYVLSSKYERESQFNATDNWKLVYRDEIMKAYRLIDRR